MAKAIEVIFASALGRVTLTFDEIRPVQAFAGLVCERATVDWAAAFDDGRSALTQSRGIDRRAALTGALLGAVPIADAPERASAAATARTVAERPAIGTPLGCAIQVALLDEAAYRQAIFQDCDLVVTEDALKWDRLRPSRDRFDFSDGDAVVRFAEAGQLTVRGHALIFHDQVPSWLDTLRTRSEAVSELRRHIATVVSHYRGKIRSWDVVNEFTDDKPERGTGLRNTIWRRLIGDDYIEMALRSAAEADPGAQLVLSDYFLEYEGRHFDARRAVMLRTAQQMVARGVPLQGVGMQGHLYPERSVDRAAVARFVTEIRALGLVVLVTELDVIDQVLPADPRQRDSLAAAQAFELLDAIAQGGGADAILTWGIRDSDSWTRFHRPRADGLPTRSLPRDDAMREKPLHAVLQHFRRRVVASAPPTAVARPAR